MEEKEDVREIRAQAAARESRRSRREGAIEVRRAPSIGGTMGGSRLIGPCAPADDRGAGLSNMRKAAVVVESAMVKQRLRGSGSSAPPFLARGSPPHREATSYGVRLPPELLRCYVAR